MVPRSFARKEVGVAEDVTGEVSTPRRTGRTVLVLVTIVTVGAALGVLLGLLLADRDTAPESAAPVFDPGVYTGEPVPLEVTGVGASSERPPAGDVTYDRGNLVDGDVTTAWSHDPAVEAAADVDLAFALGTPGDAAAELELLDQPGLQRVELPSPVLVDTVRLVVIEAVPGDTYDEVSISEVVVTGHPAQGDDLARLAEDAAG